MLTNIRNNMQGIFAKFIVALMLIPFVLFGVDSLIGFSGPSQVANVNGDKLTEVELVQAVEMQKRRIIASAGEKIDYSLIEDSKLREPALKQIIDQRLIQQFAGEQGLVVSDAIIDNAIVGMQQFQENGKFSQANYENLLANMGYSPAYFRTLMAQDIARNQIVNGLINNNFVSPDQLEMVAALVAERRTAEYVLIAPDAFRSSVVISDADIATYYQENQKEFVAQEKLKLEYLQLKESDLYKPVAEAELKAAYDKEMIDYKGKDSRHAAHILLEINDTMSEAQAKAKAEELAKQIKAGADFAELAKANSADVGSKDLGGDIGYSSGDVFDPAFEEALAALDVGQVSGPVKTEFGIHLIKLLDAKIEEKPKYEEYKSVVERRLQQQQAAPEFARLSEQLKDITFNAENLQEPADKLSLKLQKSDWINRDAKRNEGLFADERLINAAFAEEVLKDGQNSEVVELAPDNLVVVRMAEYQPEEVLSLDKVKETIRTTLVNQKASEAALAKAKELQKQIESGAKLAELAKANNLLVQAIADKPRQAIESDPLLIDVVFSQPTQPGVSSSLLDNGNVLLLQTLAVKAGKLADFSKAEKDGLIASLKQAQASADFATIMSDLHSKAEIEITLK